MPNDDSFNKPNSFFLILGGGCVIKLFKLQKAARKGLAEKQSLRSPHEVFSHIEYLSRIENLCESIWQEPREEYVLILWWGLDGLRLNKDGTSEWISKAKSIMRETPPRILNALSICNGYNSIDYRGMLQNCCADNTQRLLWRLETENSNLRCLQAAQIDLNKSVIDMLGVTYIASKTHHL